VFSSFLDEYIAAADIAVDGSGYLFRTTAPKSGALTEKPMHQQDAYRMIQRRAKAAGIETKIGNHTFRATGITAYLKNSGKLKWPLKTVVAGVDASCTRKR
jgi:integrase/recombinase XerD